MKLMVTGVSCVRQKVGKKLPNIVVSSDPSGSWGSSNSQGKSLPYQSKGECCIYFIFSHILQAAEVGQLGRIVSLCSFLYPSGGWGQTVGEGFFPLSFRRLRSDSWGRIVSFILQEAEIRQLGKDSFLYPSGGWDQTVGEGKFPILQEAEVRQLGKDSFLYTSAGWGQTVGEG
jgi:hypothetical protein